MKFWRRQKEEELDAEILSHLDEAIRDRIARGESAEQARLNAQREFGNVGLVKEVTREMWGWGWLERLKQDIRYGVRLFFKQPGFTLAAVLTLALGIGLNTAIFSVADAVLFRPLPFAEPQQLVEIYQISASQFSYPGLRWEAFQQWRGQREVFAQVEAYDPRNLTLTGVREPESVGAPAVSPGLFAMLGVRPQLGRLFVPEEAEPNNGRVVLIGHEFWQKHFGGQLDALGKTLTLNDQPYTVVGVMPPKFKFPYGKFQLWTPLTMAASNDPKQPSRFYTVARLRSDVALTAAQGRLDVVAGQLATAQPGKEGWMVKLNSLGGNRVNPGPRRALWMLLGAVAFVLLLTCANAANLLLSRAAARRGELAIRLALGAGRGRLLRQLLTESVLLSLLGGAVGVVLAWWGVDLLTQLVPDELTFLSVNEISLDRRVLWFTLAVTICAGLGAGLLPALKTTRPDLQQTLKGTSQAATADRAQNRLRNMLAITEIALSLVLLAGAGLMMRAFLRLSSVPPGFDPHHLVAATLTLPPQRYQTLEQQEEFFAQVKTRLLETPGIEAVTIAAGVPPQGGGIAFGLEIEVEGRAPEAADPKMVLPFSQVDPSYFQTLQIPIRQGRSFNAEDTVNTPLAIIINEEMARRYWPNENPINQRVRFRKTGKWYTVVGVAGEVNLGKPSDDFSKMEVYYPWSQQTQRNGHRALIVRTTGKPEKIIPTIKNAIWALDKDQPIYRIDTVASLLSDALAEPRFYLLLFGVFAGATLALVALGVYGVMAYQVSQRRHEIGIRLALGAQPRDIVRLVLGQGLRLTTLGLGAGLLAALLLARWLKSLLYEQRATDPLTLVLMALLLAVVALLACLIPARRATQVEPLTALRQQ